MGWRPSAVDNFRVNARRPHRVVGVAATHEAISTLAEILTQHGPLHKDEIAQHCRERGMDDPDSAIQWNLLEMDCPAGQLVDDRWVWLPAVLAGRVFTHRVSADESTHEVLTVTPDLDPITNSSSTSNTSGSPTGRPPASCWPVTTMSCSTCGAYRPRRSTRPGRCC